MKHDNARMLDVLRSLEHARDHLQDAATVLNGMKQFELAIRISNPEYDINAVMGQIYYLLQKQHGAERG